MSVLMGVLDKALSGAPARGAPTLRGRGKLSMWGFTSPASSPFLRNTVSAAQRPFSLLLVKVL